MGEKVNIDGLIAEIDRQALDSSPRPTVSAAVTGDGTIDNKDEAAQRTARRIKGINWRSDPISVNIDEDPGFLGACDQYLVMTQMGEGYPRQPRYLKR